MAVDIVNERVIRDEIVHWVYDDLGYYAYAGSGLTLNIVRSISVQLPIENPDDYSTFLWLETLQGFFLARQRLLDSSPQGWWLIRELMPDESHAFFQRFGDSIHDYLAGIHARLALEDAAYAPLEGRSTSPASVPPGTFRPSPG
jgi:hypothetical protein